MFKSRFAVIVMALGLGACASSPRYVPADDAGAYGHYNTQLEENRYRIVFNGRQSTGLNTTRDFALLRAAELTLQQGYDWFQVVDRETFSTNQRDVEPTMAFAYERAYYNDIDCGLLACTRSVRPRNYGYMELGNGRAQTTHSHALEIVMGSGKMPTDGGNYYDASAVAKSIWDSM
jgi:hypothetical protein